MSSYSYVPHDRSSNIGATLSNINSAFTNLEVLREFSAKAQLGDVPRLIGCTVSAGVFPALSVTAGKLLTADGKIYTFASGSVNGTATSNQVFYVFITAAFTIDIDTTVPVDALLVLAVATVNAGATAYSSVNLATTSEVFSYNGADQIETIELKSGPIVLKTWDLTYTGELVATVVETSPSRTTTHTYTYDGADNLVNIVTSSSPFGFMINSGV